ncbi:hypothetical protein DPMN_175319 [Dreissena polymorpha]|uniref:VWFD domain-containing protein n=1 Tax=Dreissena polymorpha TaxID=45954 RepID=A0A9D4E6C2_DREPO|nr:hypothetical protein DPMN_175319 [Dreissena polymorpha]
MVVADILQWPLNKGYMNVDVYMSAKDFGEGKGLCGTYNGDIADDLIYQNGLFQDLPQTVECLLRNHASFLDSWRVDDSDTMLSSLGLDTSAKWNGNKHTLCICGQFLNNTNVSGDPEQLPQCSAFDNIFCNHEEDKKHSSCVSNNGTNSRRKEIERMKSKKNKTQSQVFKMTNQSTVTQDVAFAKHLSMGISEPSKS